MIDTLLNLLFRCSHRRLSRPVTPTTRAGDAKGQTYIVCLDCGGRFGYDLDAMKMGKRLAPQEGAAHS
jgi:DNA-directed RNA polymerase subunit RPC12/RpoP